MRTARIYELEALTDIWTGDARGNGDRLIATGLLGSIRWWFEVVVRGLGGSACDPTADGRCPDPRRNPTGLDYHCVVCEFFGCTDWARKFRFDVLDEDGNTQQDQIRANQHFLLRFTPLRPILDQEWTMLDLTIRLIACHAAIGGRTVYKPTEETSRQSKLHHQDLGLVRLVSPTTGQQFQVDELRRYLSIPKWRELAQSGIRDFTWASLQHFWCVRGKHLSREGADKSSFNRVLGRCESKRCRDCDKVHEPRQNCPKTKKYPARYSDQSPASDLEKWLAGGRAESKKVFSFKNPESARRTFGFVQSPDKLDEMKKRLREKAWKDLKDEEFVTGAEIIGKFFGRGGDA